MNLFESQAGGRCLISGAIRAVSDMGIRLLTGGTSKEELEETVDITEVLRDKLTFEGFVNTISEAERDPPGDCDIYLIYIMGLFELSISSNMNSNRILVRNKTSRVEGCGGFVKAFGFKITAWQITIVTCFKRGSPGPKSPIKSFSLRI